MARIRFTSILAVMLVVALFGLLSNSFRSRVSNLATAGARRPDGGPLAATHSSVTHVVLFQWKTNADAGAINAATKRMMALRTACLHPGSGKPYLLSLKGGKDNSMEGLQNGATHGFVVEFASSEDRDYYVGTDPAHKAFVKSIGDIVEKATVLDFTNGLL